MIENITNQAWFQKFQSQFYANFIESDRWLALLKGLGNTLLITFFALILGIVIGILVAMIRSTYDKNYKDMVRRGSIGAKFLKIFNTICNIYLTIIRGTPAVVQLMIFYFVIFSLPPIYGWSAFGILIEPSAFILFSRNAISILGGATTVLLRV